MREMLISAIEDVKSGKLDQARASSIAKLASAVTQSMHLEIEARRFALGIDKDGTKLLDMPPLVLGDERADQSIAQQGNRWAQQTDVLTGEAAVPPRIDAPSRVHRIADDEAPR